MRYLNRKRSTVSLTQSKLSKREIIINKFALRMITSLNELRKLWEMIIIFNVCVIPFSEVMNRSSHLARYDNRYSRSP